MQSLHRRTTALLQQVYVYIAITIVGMSLPVTAWAAAEEGQDNSSPQVTPVTEAALSVNDPIYFVVGGRGDTKVRFQFSFKYRVFDEDSDIVHSAPWLEGFHFAYTQTSLWNLSSESRPFEDSSYKPSFFWDFYLPKKDYWPAFVRTGYEHESNGQAADASRTINTLFFWPFWGGEWHGREWLVAPKFYAYLSKDDFNQDIHEYRGYGELLLRYGHEDDWLYSTTLRHADSNRSMIQMDISLPVRKKIFSRTGGYVYLQIFHGYGESLLTYNEKQDTQVRIGFAIVR